MALGYRRVDRDQQFLLPPDMRGVVARVASGVVCDRDGRSVGHFGVS